MAINLSKLAGILISIAVAVLFLVPQKGRAGDDGATLYKAKCAACHGVDGAGKPAAKIPSLASEEARASSDAELSDGIARGGASKKATHAFQAKGVTPDQIRMIVAYIRQLQKK